MLTAKTADQGVHLGRVATLQGKRRQLQAGDPAFGATFQQGKLALAEFQPHRAAQKESTFVGRKAQVVGVQLDKLAVNSKPLQRQGRIGAADEHDLQPRRQMFEEKC